MTNLRPGNIGLEVLLFFRYKKTGSLGLRSG